MKQFSYRAIDANGKAIRGTIDAYDEYEAVTKIKSKYSVIEKINEVEAVERKGLNIDINEPLTISEKTLSLISSQFAILLRAGLTVDRAVEVIAKQTNDKYMKKILNSAAADAAAGKSLAQSLQTNSKKLPATFIETIRAGEESGTLEESFAKLSAYYEKSYKLKGKVKSALIYPIFLIVLAIVVVAVVVNVAVPAISGFMESSGGTMPIITQGLLNVYNFFKDWWWLVVLTLVVLVSVLFVYSKSENGKYKLAYNKLKIPVLGNISRMHAASQWADSMATLLFAGLPLTLAFRTTAQVLDNYAMGKDLAVLTEALEEGKTLGEVLESQNYLPPLLKEMASVGEQAGSLEDTLNTIGTYYDSEVEQASARALGLMEPVITIVMGLLIGIIVLALYAPMFTMYNSI